MTDQLIKHTIHANRLKRYVDAQDAFHTKVVAAKRRNEKILREKNEKNKVNRNKSSVPQTATSSKMPLVTNSVGRNDEPVVQNKTDTGLQKDGQNVQGVSNPLTSGKSNDGWLPIKDVLERKGAGKNIKFYVEWEDGQRSWEPAVNVSDYAKAVYHQRLESKRKRRRRRA